MYQQYKGRPRKSGSVIPESVAPILRNGGSESPDRWLNEPRNNHNMAVFQFVERKITLQGIVLFSILLCVFIWYIGLNQSGIMNEVLNDVLNIFGKDTTFSDRDIVWTKMLHSIVQHPYVGHGFQQVQIQIGTRIRTTSMYSFWGSIVYYYGLVGIIILFVGFFLCEKIGVVRGNTNNKPRFVLKLMIALLMMFGLMNDMYNWYYLSFLMELYNHSDTLYLCMEDKLSEPL